MRNVGTGLQPLILHIDNRSYECSHPVFDDSEHAAPLALRDEACDWYADFHRGSSPYVMLGDFFCQLGQNYFGSSLPLFQQFFAVHSWLTFLQSIHHPFDAFCILDDNIIAAFMMITYDLLGLQHQIIRGSGVLPLDQIVLHLTFDEISDLAKDFRLICTRWASFEWLDLDPRAVEWCFLSAGTWIITVCLCGIICLLCYAKMTFCAWWRRNPGPCRKCGLTRIPTHRLRPPKGNILIVCCFGWLIGSSLALDPLAYCTLTEQGHPSPGTPSGIRFVFEVEEQSKSQNAVMLNSCADCIRSDFCRGCRSDILLNTTRVSEAPFFATVSSPIQFAGPFWLSETLIETTDPEFQLRHGEHDHIQFNDYHVEENLQEFHLPDVTSFMQAPPLLLTEICGRHLDPQIYWDRLAFRPPIIPNRFFVWRTDVMQVGILQNSLFTVPWNGVNCVQCAYIAMPAPDHSVLLRGPFYIRPQPPPIAGVPVLQFIALATPKLELQRVLHVSANGPTDSRQGTITLNTITGIISTIDLFDFVMPNNQCRGSSWCRATWQSTACFHIWWWPITFSVPDYSHIELSEFDSQIRTQIANPPNPSTQGFVCQRNQVDPGSTDYGNDEMNLLTISMLQHGEPLDTTQADYISFMHVSPNRADRSRTTSPDTGIVAESTHEPSCEDTAALIIYWRSDEPTLISIDEDTPLDVFRLITMKHLGVTPEDEEWNCFSLHFVRPKPIDLAPCVIPIIAVRRGQQQLDKIFALIDIEIHSNRVDVCGENDISHSLRETWHLPSAINRPALLHWIGIGELCRQISLPCSIQLGIHSWPPQDSQLHTLLDGIYIAIKVHVPLPEFPLASYLEFARRNIPFDAMYDYWQRQAGDVASHLSQLFNSDDEDLSHAAAQAEAIADADQARQREFVDILPFAEYDDHHDVTSLMVQDRTDVNRQRSPRTPSNELIIYEFQHPAHSSILDPELGRKSLRATIGALMDLHPAGPIWDNFEIHQVKPLPSDHDPLSVWAFIFVHPRTMIHGFAFTLVEISVMHETTTCGRVEKTSIRSVKRTPGHLSRESFLVNIGIWNLLCVVSGNDLCQVRLPNHLWTTDELANQYLFDGMYIRVDCRTPFHEVPLQQQLKDSLAGLSYERMIHDWTPQVRHAHGLQLMQRHVQRQYSGDHCIQNANAGQSNTSHAYFRSAVEGLRPPGNPDLHTLDTVKCDEEGIYHVVDENAHQPRQLHLAELLCLPRPLVRNSRQLQDDTRTNIYGTIDEDPGKPAVTPKKHHLSLPTVNTLYEDIAIIRPQKAPPLEKIAGKISKAVYEDFMQVNLGVPDNLDHLFIYTDGSYCKDESSKQAAWAFVVLVEQNHETYLIGYGFGTQMSEALSNGWTGASKTGPRESEIDAIIHAIEWVIRYLYDADHSFCFDSVLAGNIASGIGNLPDNDSQAILLISLAIFLSQYLPSSRSIHWKHVKAHSGTLGNEIADALAKVAFQEQVSCGAFDSVNYMPYIIGPNPMVQWLWLTFRDLNPMQGLPCGVDKIETLPSTPTVIALDKAFPKATVEKFAPSIAGTAKTFQLCIVSYNVCTLQQKQGSSLPSFIVYLREQLQSHEAHVTCLQETRAKQSVVFESDTHIQVKFMVTSCHFISISCHVEANIALAYADL